MAVDVKIYNSDRTYAKSDWMNLLHLKYFYVVAKERGFTNASKLLRIQQPAISRMVGLLEDDLGFPLFERVGRNVQLTKQGQEVFEYSKKIFASVEDLEQSLGRIGGECKGPLLIAAAEAIASHCLPSVIKSLMSDHSLVYPSIFSGPASMMFDRIERGEIELGLFFHIPDLPDKLEIFDQRPTRFHVVIRRDLRRKREVCESFIGSREIDDTSNRKFPTLEKIRRIYPQAKIRISSNNLTAHREMVLQGLGVSVLPHFVVEADLKEGRLVELLPQEEFVFQMKAVKRKTAVLSSSAVALVSRL